jgi:two-component system cell cycle response regulator DivK
MRRPAQLTKRRLTPPSAPGEKAEPVSPLGMIANCDLGVKLGTVITAEPSRVILIVEDNDDNREIYSTLLKAYGFAVREASRAEAGIAIARSEHPALVLMDIGLPNMDGVEPNMDGVEATRRLKGDAATMEIPVLALTAHGLLAERQRAANAGVDGYLVKPVSGATLIREVEEALARGSARSGRGESDPRRSVKE